jgi:hypothetical protein
MAVTRLRWASASDTPDPHRPDGYTTLAGIRQRLTELDQERDRDLARVAARVQVSTGLVIHADRAAARLRAAERRKLIRLEQAAATFLATGDA